MKIAITSVSGQLGSTIAQRLITQLGKENIIGIARTPQKAEHLGIEIRKGDYNERTQFDEALKGIDTVLLISGNDKPENRIDQHRNVIEAAKQNGVQKIVYTSVLGPEDDSSFSPVVASNRQTEKDIQASGLQWSIGRNGIYIEPDLEYIETYVKEGEIRNCAGNGRCGYISRPELSEAYANMLVEDKHNGQIYNLTGESITQTELVEKINKIYGTELKFNNVAPEEYEQERKNALGDFMGMVIAGIYQGMLSGAYDISSDFEKATGRHYKSAMEMMTDFKSNN